MLNATLHLTADSLRAAPTPSIHDEITWVVLRGKPRREAISMIVAASDDTRNDTLVSIRQAQAPAYAAGALSNSIHAAGAAR